MFRSATAVFAAVLALSGVMSAGVAGAQEVIPTAKGVTPPDVSGDPPPPPIQPPAATNLAPVLPGPCGTGPVPRVAPVNADGGPQVDRSPHGEVSVGADSRGGRYAEGSVCVPIGDRSSVSIDVGQGRNDSGYWRR